MDTIEKVYCTGHDNNDALVAALASKNNCDPMAMAAMEKKETEQRFSKIEESISRMESTVNNFINSFNHAQGNSNTAQ